jgi:predicted DNA-binding transcriptional regulator YafY
MKKFERIYKLHRWLSGRRTGLSLEDLLEKLKDEGLACSRSTLKRLLLNDLRDGLQAPLKYDEERGGYYFEHSEDEPRYELPGLWFTAQELSALLVLEEVVEQQPEGLLSETLRPFRQRLEALAQKAGVGIPQWRSRLRLLRMAARPVGSHFAVVAGALAQRRKLRIDYHARTDDRMAQRTVSPQRLVLYRDNWYLDAWCHARKDLRIFALDRIIAAEKLGEPAKEIGEAHLAGTFATSYGIFAGQPTAVAVLRFTPHAVRWVAAETWHPKQEDMRDDAGALTRKLPFHRSEELVRNILSYGPDVEVLKPDSLRLEVARRLVEAVSQYSLTEAPAGYLRKPSEAADSPEQHPVRETGSFPEPAPAYARRQNRAIKP